MAAVNSVELDGRELTAGEIVEVFFYQDVWLFPQTPGVKRLKADDRLLI
ncbi:MAG TPA: hypothetical protein GX528_06885 [Firmicutes bacterium]|nr:hypothetical protein [Bacillota bacterium]